MVTASQIKVAVTAGTATASGALFAVVTTPNGTSGTPVQVATVTPTGPATPTVTSSNGNLAQNATSLTINGSSFDASFR